MSIARLLCAVLLVAALPAVAMAQSASPGARPAPCTAPANREFDFWLGSWTVTDRASGALAGTNEITSELRGCVLQEHWTGAGGGRGTSFNHYDAGRQRWHQTWVDDSGTLLLLDGRMQNGSMVLSGRRTGRDGRPVFDRISWTPSADGSVRQFWESSRDGTTWMTSFDGIYRKTR